MRKREVVTIEQIERRARASSFPLSVSLSSRTGLREERALVFMCVKRGKKERQGTSEEKESAFLSISLSFVFLRRRSDFFFSLSTSCSFSFFRGPAAKQKTEGLFVAFPLHPVSPPSSLSFSPLNFADRLASPSASAVLREREKVKTSQESAKPLVRTNLLSKQGHWQQLLLPRSRLRYSRSPPRVPLEALRR
jgi:hypothetical protein